MDRQNAESFYNYFYLYEIMKSGWLLVIGGIAALIVGSIVSTLFYYQILKW